MTLNVREISKERDYGEGLKPLVRALNDYRNENILPNIQRFMDAWFVETPKVKSVTIWIEHESNDEGGSDPRVCVSIDFGENEPSTHSYQYESYGGRMRTQTESEEDVYREELCEWLYDRAEDMDFSFDDEDTFVSSSYVAEKVEDNE
jgi:hypothetical protein